ncbi:MAG: winged helix-turn-helix domain-containing protein [Candidatus Aenigmarchaeota archaeon]|nr:winged helix-turn-helix domain-containing protein [Candidatus Aenigmarchaeota archaeon]
MANFYPKIDMQLIPKMVQMYNSGISMGEIANKLKLSSGTVHFHLKKQVQDECRKKRQHKTAFYNSDVVQFKEMYLRGQSTIDIAKKYNTDNGTVRYYLNKVGVDTSKNGKFSPKVTKKQEEIMQNLYRKTGSISKTANMLKLHPSSVHYRLVKAGIVKKRALNQKVAKEKYEILTEVLSALFNKMGYKINHTQKIYNGHGPDMIVSKHGKSIIIEHKATVKRSFYWKHGIGEASRNRKNHDAQSAWVITTASKPTNFCEGDVKVIFYEDLIHLLEIHNLHNLLPSVEYISNTPSV